MSITASNIIDLNSYPKKRYASNAASPFRYPGGKGFLTPFLEDQLVKRFNNENAEYAEPYCGGAGAALNLLLDCKVRQLHLNDADPRIYSAWKAMLFETDRFLEKLETVNVNISSWNECQQKIHDNPINDYDFDLGFSTFFINRTSRSGVIIGSGPIGGYDQEGNWKIDARFNKKNLSKKISEISRLRDNISLTRLDGLEFCKLLGQKADLNKTLLFVDPPYVQAGGRLYLNGMNLAKHDALATWLQNGSSPHWVLTYDNHPIILDLYSQLPPYRIQVQYSLAKRRVEKELLYMSKI